jgi:hypothetical protein
MGAPNNRYNPYVHRNPVFGLITPGCVASLGFS